MAILPEGFALPPPTYLAALLVAAGLVGWAAVRRRPAVTADRVLAFAPWMVLGSALHVLYVVDALPALVRPLAGTPAVYLTVGTVAVGALLAADALFASSVSETTPDAAGLDAVTVPAALATAGSGLALVAVVAVLARGATAGTLSPVVPLAALVASVVVAAVVWAALCRAVPAIGATGRLGAFAVFAHVLDGVSTAAGVDLLGFAERTPLSRLIMEFAAGLPTAPVLGSGWLFVVVKVAVASVLVWLFADLVEEDPTQSRLLLGVVAAVGLGPAAHNLLLFTITTPA
ncbi:MAG: DUF63 family protein [Haloquadratum sp.]